MLPDLYPPALDRLELLTFVEGLMASLRAGMARARSRETVMARAGEKHWGKGPRGLRGPRHKFEAELEARREEWGKPKRRPLEHATVHEALAGAGRR